MEKQKAKASLAQRERNSDLYLDYNCSLTLRKVKGKTQSRSKGSVSHQSRKKRGEE